MAVHFEHSKSIPRVMCLVIYDSVWCREEETINTSSHSSHCYFIRILFFFVTESTNVFVPPKKRVLCRQSGLGHFIFCAIAGLLSSGVIDKFCGSGALLRSWFVCPVWMRSRAASDICLPVICPSVESYHGDYVDLWRSIRILISKRQSLKYLFLRSPLASILHTHSLLLINCQGPVYHIFCARSHFSMKADMVGIRY
jgi:hypothetical protein